jgi:O-methyltransferase
MKGALRHLASRAGYEIFKAGSLQRERLRYTRLVHDLVRLAERPLFELPETPGRAHLFSELIGTEPVQALFMLRDLHRALEDGGDVCEFGVAQGATSALIANELLHHAPERVLWLYDSFQGLPAPGMNDVLLDDPLGLGSMAAYEGKFAEPRTAVEGRLSAVGWPRERTRIVEGFFSQETPAADLPEQVSFAYVDFDLYQPVKDALDQLSSRTRVGSRIMVDDYGFLSSGAKTAVDEFVATQATASWTLSAAPPGCQPFASLCRDR